MAELRECLGGGEPCPVDALGGHCVVGVRHEDDPGSEGNRLARQAFGVALAVPALVVVQDPGRDRLDSEGLQHAEADLGVPLEDEALRVGECVRLTEDLLGDRELAEIMQSAGETDELDVLGGEPKAAGDLGGKLTDRVRVAARIGVPGVDGVSKRRRSAEARLPVGPLGELVELCDIDQLGMEEARPALAGTFRLVESFVRRLNELSPVGGVARVGCDSGRDACLQTGLELRSRHPLHDLLGRRYGVSLLGSRHDQGELVAADPERLLALPELARQACEHAVSDRMAAKVVDPLEVVDVNETEAHGAAGLACLGETASRRSWK